MTQNVVYFDIETVGNPDMQKLIPVPEPASKSDAPRNYKKPEAIAKWIATENSRRTQDYNKAVKEMGLDVEYARVAAIGYAVDDEPISVNIVNGDGSESNLLRDFWNIGGVSPRYCGFNVLSFDLPILIRRSCLLGIHIQQISLARYKTDDVVDLMELLSDWGKRRFHSLKYYCEMFGVEDPMPDHDGSMVAEMDATTLSAYAAAGAEMARGLALRTRGWYWL